MTLHRTLFSWLLLFLFGFSSTLFAGFTEVKLRLPQYSVIDALQDKQGYLWLATGTGLARYDGYNLKVYQQQVDDKNSLPANLLMALFEDNQENLWVGTANGIARLNKETDQFKRYLTTIGATESDFNAFQVFYQTPEGVLLVGGRNGLFRYDALADAFFEITYKDQSIGVVWRVAEQQGEIWIASDSGLAVLDAEWQVSIKASEPVQDWIVHDESLWLSSGSWQSPYVYALDHAPVLQWPNFRRFFRDASGQAWTYGEAGLAKLLSNGELSWQFVDMEVFHLHETAQGELLISGNKGVYRFDSIAAYWQAIPIKTINKQNPVERLFETHDGTVFAVQGQGGLARWVPTAQKFVHYQPPLLQAYDSRGNNVVRHVYEQLTADGKILWLSTRQVAKKLFLTADDKEIAKTELFELPVADKSYVNFHAVQPLASKQILVATARGLYWLNEETGFYTFAELNALLPLSTAQQSLVEHAEVFQFYKDETCLWLLTNAGFGCASLDAMDIHHWFSSDEYPFLKNNNLHNAFRAKDGALWLSGTNGVIRFDPTKVSFQHFSHDPSDSNSLAHNWVHGVWQTANDTFWLATREGGLNRLIWQENQPTQWQRFGRKDGLPSEVIYGILGDESGWLWLSTSQGIVRIHSETYEVRAYQPEDGVQSDEFNFSVMHVGQNGRLYFGGINGVNGFNPPEVVDNAVTPIIRLASWAIHDKAELISDVLSVPISLAYNQNHLSFDYVGLHFADPGRITYQYWLEGADVGWVDAGIDRSARYGALKPGQYHFWVKAANPDAVWSEPVLLKSFIIKPHPLLSPWAWACYLFLLLTFLWMYKRFRDATEYSLRLKVAQGVAREAALGHHLRVQFEHTIHEMRTPLMRLATHAERSSETLSKLTISPQTISLNNALKAMLQAQQELQLLVENQQRLEELKLRYEHHPVAIAGNIAVTSECMRLKHYADEKCIEFSWQLEDIYLQLIPGVLELITAHLVGNAIKYCQKGACIEVSLTACKTLALLTVKDNGSGIKPDDLPNIFIRHYRGAGAENIPGKGEGLFLVKTCVDNAGGYIEVESKAEQGSCFKVLLPLAQQQFASEAKLSAAVNGVVAEEGGYKAAHVEINVAEECALTSERQAIVPSSTEVSAIAKTIKNKELIGVTSFKVLLVEDNQGLREDLITLLSAHYQCVAASSAQEGMALAKQYLPDVILSDVMMEQKNSGLILLEYLKNTLETSHIPVVLLTALADQQSQLKGYQYQANAYLTKPASDAAILACVATQLAQSARLTMAVRAAIKQERLLAMAKGDRVKVEDTVAVVQAHSAKRSRQNEAINANSTEQLVADSALVSAKNKANAVRVPTPDADIFTAKLQGVFSSCYNQPNVKVADIAKAFYKSESELQRKCKDYTGESVAALLQKYRYQQACKLLSQHSPQFSIEQVAEQSGFGTVRTMQRTFNQLSGQSPLQFRQQHEGKRFEYN
ncbi:ATP-binding protein [Alishewanella longhuensis]